MVVMEHRCACEFVEEACSYYSCGESIPRRRIEQHERHYAAKLVPCPDCLITRARIHIRIKKIIPCDICGELLPRKHMAARKQTAAPEHVTILRNKLQMALT